MKDIKAEFEIDLYNINVNESPPLEIRYPGGEYITLNCFLAIMCIEGEADIFINYKKYHISKSSFVILERNVPFFFSTFSNDLNIDVIRIGGNVDGIAHDESLRVQMGINAKEKPLYSISEYKLDFFHRIHSYMKYLMDCPPDTFSSLIIKNYMNILMLEAHKIMQEDKKTGTSKRENTLAFNFLHCLEENFRKERKVRFYADKLNVSTKHLTCSIMEVTGKHPSTWIENYSVMEIKKLLSMSSLSIKEISYELNFSSSSHLSHFFKQQTGMTPVEYRKKYSF